MRLGPTARVLAMMAALASASCAPDDGPILPSRQAEPGATGQATLKESVLEAVDEGTAVLQGWSGRYEPVAEVRLIEVGESWGGSFTGCGGGPFTPGNAYYCPDDNKLYFDLNWLGGLDSGARRAGAVVTVVMHELGHSWEHSIGYLANRGGTTVEPELFADCMAGALVAAIGGDLESAGRVAFSVGGYAVDNPGFHGTPQQRRTAVANGAEKGHEACDAYLR